MMKEIGKCGLCDKVLSSGIETFGEFGDVPQCSSCWFGMTDESETAKLWREDEKATPKTGYIISESDIVETPHICDYCEKAPLEALIGDWCAVTGTPFTFSIYCPRPSCRHDSTRWEWENPKTFAWVRGNVRIDTKARQERGRVAP